MPQHPFLAELKRRLVPVLRADGFSGSGTTFRRVDGPIVHVFNIQASTAGRECFLNLGAHLDFLPSAGGKQIAADELLEYHCVFRGRIDPPTGPTFGWAYPDRPEDISESVALILEEWKQQGGRFFSRYNSYPSDFEKLVAATDPAKLHPIDGRVFARIALGLGDRERAVSLARAALANAPASATFLRQDLEQLLREIQTNSAAANPRP